MTFLKKKFWKKFLFAQIKVITLNPINKIKDITLKSKLVDLNHLLLFEAT